MVNCMFPYNVASLILEILYLKYALNDPLGHRCWKNMVCISYKTYIAENLTDLLHSQLITCTMKISEFKNMRAYLGVVKLNTFNLNFNSTFAQEVWSLNQFTCMCLRENKRVTYTHIHTISILL